MRKTCELLISAGVPGSKDHDETEESGQYPIAAQDLSKILQERGISVKFQHDREHRQYVSLHSAEVWLPIISVTSDLLAAVGGGLLSDVIRDFVFRPRATERKTLHVDYRIEDASGEVHHLKVDGDSEDVYPLIDKFEETWRDREGD